MYNVILRVVLVLMSSGVDSKITHIKVVREMSTCSLLEAKLLVEKIYKDITREHTCEACHKVRYYGLEDVGGAQVCGGCIAETILSAF